MRQPIFFILFSLVLLTACHTDPMELLNQAKDKINSSGSIAYKQIALWPNPVGRVDTVVLRSSFYKKENAYYDYDFIGQTKRADAVYINDDFKQVTHRDSTVLIYPKEREERFVKENIFITSSPLTFINYPSWAYTKDTLIQGQEYTKYRRVEMDTIIDGNEVYVENNIFINQASALLDRYERIAYFNGEKSQTITEYFLDYKLSKEGEPLTYEFPEKYTTRIFEDKWKSPLSTGQEAPLFSAKDIQGNQINLKDLQGKKVLLNFSVINCGYCKKALEYLNREDYQISDSITGLYINPIDEKSEVEDYADEITIPFPVIAGEKGMIDKYGISVYPTFVLIDEQGKIEKINYGYNEDFFDSLKMQSITTRMD